MSPLPPWPGIPPWAWPIRSDAPTPASPTHTGGTPMDAEQTFGQRAPHRPSDDSRDLVRTLGQRKWWTTSDGTRLRRKRMPLQHKANTLAWLIRNSDRIVNSYVLRPVFLFIAPDDVQAELDEMLRDPETWVLRQPFTQALIRDLIRAAELTPADLGLVSREVQDHHGAYYRTWVDRPTEKRVRDVLDWS